MNRSTVMMLNYTVLCFVLKPPLRSFEITTLPKKRKMNKKRKRKRNDIEVTH